jgi:hypothetical protein
VSAVACRWNLILPSLLNTFEELQKLAFTYHNGNILIIVPEKRAQYVHELRLKVGIAIIVSI